MGLIGRRGLATGEALLIPGCRSVHTIGMRFPIDVAFVRPSEAGFQVVAVRRRIRPGRLCRVRSPRKERISALELGAGEAGRLGIRPGSSLPAARFL